MYPACVCHLWGVLGCQPLSSLLCVWDQPADRRVYQNSCLPSSSQGFSDGSSSWCPTTSLWRHEELPHTLSIQPLQHSGGRSLAVWGVPGGNWLPAPGPPEWGGYSR